MARHFSSNRYLLLKTFCLLLPSLLFLQLNAQTFSWAKQMGGLNANANTAMGQIKIDADGNIFQSVTSTSAIDVDPGPGVFNFSGGIVKLSSAGNFIWAKQIPGSFIIDGAGNIYSTGVFKGTMDFDPGPGVSSLASFGYDDIFILKFDVNANLVWAKQVGGNYMERSGGIALSANGIIITGGFGYGGNISPINSCDFDPDLATTYSLTNVGGWDGFILTLDFNGQFVSVFQKGTTADETIGSVCVDNNGNFIYPINSKLEKSNPNGNLLWSIDISGISWAMAPITVDASGNILISGGYMGTFDIDPGPGVAMVPSVTMSGSLVQAPFVGKFDGNGNFLWVRTLTANGFANGVTSDAAGNVYTVGYFNYNGSVDFDPGPGTYNFKVAALAGYVQKLSPTGNFVWAAKIGGEIKTNTIGRAIGLNNSNDVITTLQFNGIIDVDPGAAKLTMKSIGSRDVIFHKMTQPVTPSQRSTDFLVAESKIMSGITAYPNPNNGSFYVDVPVVGEGAQLQLYSMSGQLLLRRSFNGEYDQRLFFSKEIKSAGVYLLQVTGKEKTFNTRIAVR